MTLEIMHRKKHGTNVDLLKMLESIKKNRCRKLTFDDIDIIYNDIEEEVLLSSAVYDLEMEKSGNGLGKFFGR
jgi:hypothetical protein